MSKGTPTHFKVNLILSEFNGKATQKKEEEIMCTICALLNAEGGQVDMNMDADFPEKTIHDLIRKIEQRFQNVIGELKTSVCIKELTVHERKISLTISPINDYLCTLNYNLFLPSTTKAIPRSVQPIERLTIESIVEGKRYHVVTELGSHRREFLGNQQLGEDFLESHNLLFKPIKSIKKEITNLKFQSQVSALANDSGGHIYLGISTSGIVNDDEVKKNFPEITSKVEKTVENMVWGRNEKPIRAREWDIYFKPVKDEDVIKRYIIEVSVKPFKGGVFTAVPECYHVVGDSVKQMDIHTWMDELLRRRTLRQCNSVDEHVRSINVSAEFSASVDSHGVSRLASSGKSIVEMKH